MFRGQFEIQIFTRDPFYLGDEDDDNDGDDDDEKIR